MKTPHPVLQKKVKANAETPKNVAVEQVLFSRKGPNSALLKSACIDPKYTGYVKEQKSGLGNTLLLQLWVISPKSGERFVLSWRRDRFII